MSALRIPVLAPALVNKDLISRSTKLRRGRLRSGIEWLGRRVYPGVVDLHLRRCIQVVGTQPQ